MKRFIAAATATIALTFAGTAAAALAPGVYDPGNTGCPVATCSGGVLHLEKNCPTVTEAAAGADITGLAGQTFSSAAFTLSAGTVCNGGSPRFDIVTDQGTADITNIRVNGTLEVPLVGPPTSKDQCKNGGWKTFNNPTFKNQGQCVSYVEHHKTKPVKHAKHQLKHGGRHH